LILKIVKGNRLVAFHGDVKQVDVKNLGGENTVFIVHLRGEQTAEMKGNTSLRKVERDGWSLTRFNNHRSPYPIVTIKKVKENTQKHIESNRKMRV